jgi:hypothetical protein
MISGEYNLILIKKENEMKKSNLTQLSRRNLITKFIPGCAAAFLFPGKALGLLNYEENDLLQQETHKFDKEIPGYKQTLSRNNALQYRKFIQFAKFLEKELGKEKMIELVKKHSTERLLMVAKRDQERLGKTDFKSYISIFRDPDMLEGLTMEILEDTDKVFEIKVTECLSATTFLRADAGYIGYARICWGDYAWAEGFNPKIKLVRDKTLMQGNDCCNHRYIWTG